MDRFQKSGAQKERWSIKLPKPLARYQQKVDRSIERFNTAGIDDAELLFVPRDLQTCDPSAFTEMKAGHFGLDGVVVEIGEGHPGVFDALPDDPGFGAALHGFSWLRDLRDAGQPEAVREAQRLVLEWITRFHQVEGQAYEPHVLARRILSFLMNTPMILRELDKKRSRRFMRTLVQQIAVLRSRIDRLPAGEGHLVVLCALAMGGLCLSRHDELLREVTPRLKAELDRQILPDGGHVSRNPGLLLPLLFDLRPLKEGYKARERALPDGFEKHLARMGAMLRFMRTGDASLARFNGMGVTPTDAIATILAEDGRKLKRPEQALASGYARLEAGAAVLLCDIGAVPPAQYGGRAHAGCLSFELSVRHFALIVNAGAYAGEDADWRGWSRATPAHSTLSIDGFSSGGFDKSGALGGPGPGQVEVLKNEALSLDALHRGYEKRFGLFHRRALSLSPDGLVMSGTDSLEGRGGEDQPIARIRFHLHPLIKIAPFDGRVVFLLLPDGEVWRFSATGAQIRLEDSHYLAYRRGVEPAHQILLEAAARPGARIGWQFTQHTRRPDPV